MKGGVYAQTIILIFLVPSDELLSTQSPQYLLIQQWHDYYRLEEELVRQSYLLKNNHEGSVDDGLRQTDNDVPKYLISPLNPHESASFLMIIELNQWQKAHAQFLSFKNFALIVKRTIGSLRLKKLSMEQMKCIRHTLEFFKRHGLLQHTQNPGVILLQLFPELQKTLEACTTIYFISKDKQNFLQFYRDSFQEEPINTAIVKMEQKIAEAERAFFEASNEVEYWIQQEEGLNNKMKSSLTIESISCRFVNQSDVDKYRDEIKAKKNAASYHLQESSNNYENLKNEAKRSISDIKNIAIDFNKDLWEKQKKAWSNYYKKEYLPGIKYDIVKIIQFHIEANTKKEEEAGKNSVYFKEWLEEGSLLKYLDNLNIYRKQYKSLIDSEIFLKFAAGKIASFCMTIEEEKRPTFFSDYTLTYHDVTSAFKHLLEDLKDCQPNLKFISELPQESHKLLCKDIQEIDVFNPRDLERLCEKYKIKPQISGATFLSILKENPAHILSILLIQPCFQTLIPGIKDEEMFRVSKALKKMAPLVNALILTDKIKRKLAKPALEIGIPLAFDFVEPISKELFSQQLSNIKSMLSCSFQIKNGTIKEGLGKRVHCQI